MSPGSSLETTARHPVRLPVIGHEPSCASVTDQVTGIVLERPTGRMWLMGFALSGLLLMVLLLSTAYLIFAGIGIWGINVPVAWGFAIVNFVWWIRIGHAGALISAMLLLTRQPWRNSISRLTESMTLFALICAGLFPLLHLGRPWFFYWMLPYPNSMDVWPQFRSALVWDLLAILAHMVVSLLFWYIGMVPDLASLRDRAQNPRTGRIYAALALGWRGEASHWHRFEQAYVLLAAAALVVSVHMIVALDFAVTLVPGWHSTILPPYFIAGAMHSGVAMMLVLSIPLRRSYRLEALITDRHFDALAKLLLTTAMLVAYGYVMELFGQWYSDREYGAHVNALRLRGEYAVLYWVLVGINVLVPQLLWSRRLRVSRTALWLIGCAVLAGMWLEPYLIVISSLHQDYLPSSWGPYRGTLWDWATFAGTFGLFFLLFLLFVRFLPAVSMFEIRHLVVRRDQAQRNKPAGGAP